MLLDGAGSLWIQNLLVFCVFVEITVSYCPSEVLPFTMKSLHFSFPASLGREKLFIQG